MRRQVVHAACRLRGQPLEHVAYLAIAITSEGNIERTLKNGWVAVVMQREPESMPRRRFLESHLHSS